MEMHQVRYFLAVARTLNFTRAAEECNVAQPSLTRAIKLLEDELGGDLFRRERSLSHLTDLGIRMLPLLQQCYESALTAKALAKDVKSGKVATLCLALSRTIGMELVVAHLTELSRAMPGLELRILRGTAPEISEALKKGDVEVALAGDLGPLWERLDTWALFTECSSLAVPKGHRLAGKNGAVELSELNSERLLVRSHCEQAEELSAQLRARGISPRTLHRVCSETDLAVLLAAGLGVTIAPNSASLPDAASRLELAELQLTRTVSAYSVAGRPRTLAASMLLNLLRAADWSHLTGRAGANSPSRV